LDSVNRIFWGGAAFGTLVVPDAAHFLKSFATVPTAVRALEQSDLVYPVALPAVRCERLVGVRNNASVIKP